MRNKKLLVVIIVVLVLIGVVTLSFAFFSIGGKQEFSNTFNSGCLNIKIDSESDAIILNRYRRFKYRRIYIYCKKTCVVLVLII